MVKLKYLYYLTACFAMAVLYCLLAFYCFNPDVSEQYKNYYIKKTTDISPGQLKLLNAVTIGEYKFDSFSSLLYSGWCSPEKRFIWTCSKSPELYFLVDDPTRFEYVMMALGANGIQNVEVYLNGVFVKSYTGIEGDSQIKFTVKGLLKTGLNQLVLPVPLSFSPNSLDARQLGVYLVSISFM